MSSDDDDGDDGHAAGGGRATASDDVDWEIIQEENEEWVVGFSLFFSFWCFMPKGEKL